MRMITTVLVWGTNDYDLTPGHAACPVLRSYLPPLKLPKLGATAQLTSNIPGGRSLPITTTAVKEMESGRAIGALRSAITTIKTSVSEVCGRLAPAKDGRAAETYLV